MPIQEAGAPPTSPSASHKQRSAAREDSDTVAFKWQNTTLKKWHIMLLDIFSVLICCKTLTVLPDPVMTEAIKSSFIIVTANDPFLDWGRTRVATRFDIIQ